MLYCKVENGVISNPQPLPINYANISNFYISDEQIINAYGFYRYQATEVPPYNPFSDKIIESLTFENDVVSSNYSIVPLSQEEIMQKLQDMKVAFVDLVDQFLDQTVQAKDYKNILHACSYSESLVPQYKAESLAVIHWRDLVWGKTYEIQNAVLAGQRSIPSESEFLAELPQLEWPNA